MSTPPEPPAPESPPKAAGGPASEAQDSGTKGDLIALGIGCGVFVILGIALVLVAMSGR